MWLSSNCSCTRSMHAREIEIARDTEMEVLQARLRSLLEQRRFIVRPATRDDYNAVMAFSEGI